MVLHNLFRTIITAFLAVLATALLSGCSKPEVKSYSVPGKSIQDERMEKDAAYRMERDSPIPPQDRARFQGLQYYPVNPGLRFRVRLKRNSNPEPVRLGTNTGEMRSGRRYGYVDFQVANQPCRLQVYQLDEKPDPGMQSQLFIPFRDSTSGKETYGAGRYLDVREDPSGLLNLDFNRAYNPSCAYGGDFSCPLPPVENTLRIPIEAGEKTYH